MPVTAEVVFVPVGDGVTFGKESELLERAPVGDSGELSGGGGGGGSGLLPPCSRKGWRWYSSLVLTQSQWR